MKIRTMLGAFALALVLVLASTAPATAQTVQAFNVERTIALSDILTTISPNLPASTLAALAGGALEIREVLAYNSQSNTLTSTIFAVPTGSPIPTPPAALANLGSALVAVVTMAIDKIYVTETPFMAISFIGTDSQSTTTPYGSYQGAVSNVSVGFTTDTPPKISNVIESVAGAIVIYSPTATVNTVTVTAPPTTGGGGGTTTGPTVVIAPIANPVLVKTVFLDASGSTDPSGQALTYQWSIVGNTTPASLLHGNSAVATAILGSNGPQTYTFMVTVTDTAGNSATGTVTVIYQ
jgi:hypothetical protein